MVPTRPTHRLVSVGVQGAPERSFLERNADAVFRMFTGALGPRGIEATRLLGEEATRERVTDALHADSHSASACEAQIVYFSGRAGARGLRVADGFLAMEALGGLLDQASAPRTLLLLDVVTSEIGRVALVQAMEALAGARPGLRIAAYRARAVKEDPGGTKLGRFTAALLAALLGAGSDVTFAGAPFISDKRALDAARDILQRQSSPIEPLFTAATSGDMPLVRSQASEGLGTAEILGLSVGEGLSATVRVGIHGRRHLRTRLRYKLVDPSSEVIAAGVTAIEPDEDAHAGRARIRFPSRLLRDHAVWGALLDMHQAVHLRWRVELRDTLGRLLAKKTYGHEYDRPPADPRPS